MYLKNGHYGKMTPPKFIANRNVAELTESSESQSHVNDLFSLPCVPNYLSTNYNYIGYISALLTRSAEIPA